MIPSDLKFDKDKCHHCGRLLHKHLDGHELYPTLRMYDGDIVDVVVAEVTCANCRYINEIFYCAWLPSTPNMKRLIAEYEGRKRFAWAPTV